MTITVNIPDEEASFLKALLARLGYQAELVDGSQDSVPAWHDEVLKERLAKLEKEERFEWNEWYLRENRESLGL